MVSDTCTPTSSVISFGAMSMFSHTSSNGVMPHIVVTNLHSRSYRNFDGKFLIDREGNVYVPSDDVEADIQSLLAQQPATEL
jgi:hypothetical protein